MGAAEVLASCAVCDSFDYGLVKARGVYFVKEGNFDEVTVEMPSLLVFCPC